MENRCGKRESSLAVSLRGFMQQRGFRACDDDRAIGDFHALAETLIPGPIASQATMSIVQERGRSCLYLRPAGHSNDAFVAIFAFSRAGEAAIEAGVFSALRIKPDWIEPPSAATRLGYVWGFGASSRAGSVAVLRALKDMRKTLFGHVALMARAATNEGEALMAPFGLQPRGERFFAPAPALEHAS